MRWGGSRGRDGRGCEGEMKKRKGKEEMVERIGS